MNSNNNRPSNRKERRAFERFYKKKKNQNKMLSSPFYKYKKGLNDERIGTNNSDLLLNLVLADHPNPEPIHITIQNYNEGVLNTLRTQKVMPALCITQESDGRFSEAFANGWNWSEFLETFKVSSQKDHFITHGSTISQEVLNIEVIKCLNFTYEKLATAENNPRMRDVNVFIFSKRTPEEIKSETKIWVDYFANEYHGARHLLIESVLLAGGL